MILHSSPKTYYKGTHRTISPEETKRIILKKIRHSNLPIYEKIIRIDHLDKIGIPVYAVIHSNRFNNSRLPSWGKGLTDDLAYVSGLMERVERYSASDIYVRRKEIIYSEFKGIKDERMISRWDLIPCNLQRKLYSKKEIDKQVRPWVRCFSLTKNKNVLIPANLIFFKADGCKDDFSDTTGLASGNNIEEAILHGLCEVIERHLQDVIHWNKIKVPSINIESICDYDLKRIITKIQSKGMITLHLSYLTSDFKIPVIRVFGYPKKGPYLGSFGFYTSVGVHPDKKIALARALTEFVQARVSGLYRIKNKYDKVYKFKVFPYNIYNFFNDIIGEDTLPFDKIVSYKNKDILEDIELIINILHSKGCEIIVKDLTHPKIGIPTVRVLVKGLQPGIFGIGIVDLNHKAARISKYLDYYSYLQKNIQNITLTDG